jgi:GAF domain-containing protein
MTEGQREAPDRPEAERYYAQHASLDAGEGGTSEAALQEAINEGARQIPSMSEKKGLREDLRSEVEALVASDAPDEEVLNEVVRRVHEAHSAWDWSGIYLLVGDILVLGPCTAPVDHSRIGIGEGVCGTAVSEDRNQVVDDVREVENYLACSIHTRSELVVLIRDAGRIVGEFDIDSDTVGAFSQEDQALLEEMGALISGRVASLAGSSESS